MEREDLIQSMKKTGHIHIYDLAKSDIIDIPPVQRSLVWKPVQVELLWDSILRGFPIGAFILSEYEDGFYLMDGQQRYNAICLGFCHQATNKSKLWLDIAPKFARNSTRKFLVKATTISHPWGYYNDDTCSTFATHEKREAMKRFGKEGTTLFQQQVSIEDTWPIRANFPIPLHIIFEFASLSSADEFASQCLKALNSENQRYQDYLKGQTDIDAFELLKTFYSVAQRVRNNYFIPFSLLDQSVVENEQDEQQDRTATTDIEVLFQRITTGGTRISQAELNYSAIKVYWPAIKDVCEVTALECMPAYDLANMAFRLYKLVNSEKKEWVKNNLRLSEIRNLSTSDYEAVNIFFSDLPRMVNIANTWLTDGAHGMPPILKTAIARQCPDIYLLVLWFAYQKSPLSGDFICALTLLLKWHTTDYADFAASIYRHCMLEGISPSSVIKGIYACRREKWRIVWPCPTDELHQMLSTERLTKQWTHWKMWGKKRFDLWNIIRRTPWECPDMLLYAERKYMSSRFPCYDPSQRDMWENVNRPWDYDHIIPHNWIFNRKYGDWRLFCREWLNVIGNLAAIPFEVNRAKGNTENWDYYKKHEQDLLVSADIYASEFNHSIVCDESMAIAFAKATIDRTLKIYDNVYQTIKIITESEEIESYPKNVQDRKNRISQFIEQATMVTGSRPIPRFIDSDTGIEYCVETPDEWAYPWIGVEIDVAEEIVLAVSLNNEKTFKIGFRISPNMRQKSDKAADITQRLLVAYPDMEESEDGHWYVNHIYTETSIFELAREYAEICRKFQSLYTDS